MDDFGLALGLGGAHLHRVEPASFDRPRWIKSQAQATGKWLAGTSNASGPQGSWVTNLTGTTKPIVARALEQQPVMVANFTRAVQVEGKYASGLARAGGDAGIKQAARDKEANYGTGTAQGSPGANKFNTFIGKLLAYEAQNLPQIYAMPKGTLAAGKARMNAWADIMAAGAGSFG